MRAVSAQSLAIATELPTKPVANRTTSVSAATMSAVRRMRRALEELGLSVPGDVSAAGYDGITVGKVISLTTVQQDTAALGSACAAELIRAVEEGEQFVPRKELIPCSLFTGATVKKI